MPSDCSIGADASNAAIAKTVEDLVASVAPLLRLILDWGQ